MPAAGCVRFPTMQSLIGWLAIPGVVGLLALLRVERRRYVRVRDRQW